MNTNINTIMKYLFNKNTLLAVCNLVIISACGGGSNSTTASPIIDTPTQSETPTSIPTPTPEPVPTPSPTPTPEPVPTPSSDEMTIVANANFIGYFENKVFDNDPEEIFAVDTFVTGGTTNDTTRVQQALNRASNESDGGIVILRVAQNSNNNRYSLARLNIPSNIRLEIGK